MHTRPITPSTVIINAGGGSGGTGTYTVSAGGTAVNYGAAATTSYTWNSEPSPNTIHVRGDAVFDGTITWQGRDMREWFESVESRLGMLRPNPKLEQGWEELANLRQQYVELENKLLEQQRVFDILKKE